MSRRAAFTIVELLVVIAIIGILVALLIPAVQYAREAARRTQCINNLKQVGLAAIQHESEHKYYATRVDAVTLQEGTWITAIMPFMEESTLHDEWAQTVKLVNGPQPAQLLFQVITKPVATLYCPTRRPVAAYPVRFQSGFKSFEPGPAAHTDYALNGGAAARADDLKITWPGIWEPVPLPGAALFLPKRIRYKDIKDGHSKTYLVAEKAVIASHYTSLGDWGNDSSIYDCLRSNCLRFARRAPVHDPPAVANNWLGDDFGSAHPSSFNAVFCDGSVRSLSYDINFATHAALASRAAADKADLSN
jgi:prepilin-type N-terminal cleavage/methylation domain-containing protein/prepilin-type processing-associated H-X9-DG protein